MGCFEMAELCKGYRSQLAKAVAEIGCYFNYWWWWYSAAAVEPTSDMLIR